MNNRSKASAKYNRDNTIQLLIRLNKKTDRDIIDILNKVDSKQGYIKDLIREDRAGECLYYDWIKNYN